MKHTIAIDAMGGDFGVSVTVPACLNIIAQYPNIQLILVGDTEKIQQQLKICRATTSDRLSIQHASQEVAMDESPSKALRGKKDSSMRVAINLVRSGQAEAIVSAGNTGALMATARFVLKTVPGIDRPAIIAAFPTVKADKEVRVLDLGANVDSCADHLYQFAVMGSILVSAVEGIEKPKVGLLNIGEEEMKGNDQVKHTAQLLVDSHLVNYIGYVEGDDIFKGDVDVVVCDGFVGNITLKAIEGGAKMFAGYIREAFESNWYTRFSYLLTKPVINIFKKRIDPARRNGASLIGLNGIVIKSHGSANEKSFANAIKEAIREVDQNISNRIRSEIGLAFEESEHE